jgi:hypothetical protein
LNFKIYKTKEQCCKSLLSICPPSAGSTVIPYTHSFKFVPWRVSCVCLFYYSPQIA